MAQPKRRERFGSDYAHLQIAPPAALTPAGRAKLITSVKPGLNFDIHVLATPPNQVTPATPVQLAIDLIIERASWYEPSRNRLEIFDGNAYLRFIVNTRYAAADKPTLRRRGDLLAPVYQEPARRARN